MYLWNIHFLICGTIIFIFSNLTEADENIWSHGMGNAYNTHRRIPTIPTEYNGKSWELVFNLSKSIISIPSMAIGINGDIYFFTGNDPIKSR